MLLNQEKSTNMLCYEELLTKSYNKRNCMNHKCKKAHVKRGSFEAVRFNGIVVYFSSTMNPLDFPKVAENRLQTVE